MHRNADDPASEIPYLLDVQNDLLSDLATRIVVPLIRAGSFGRRADRLHPTFEVEGTVVVMGTHLMAAVRERSLGETVGSLGGQRDVIIDAIDVLWSGV